MTLACVVAIPLGYMLFTGRTLMLRDLLNIWNPWQIFYRNTILSGSVPLWQPYMAGGEPFLADIQTATLYPLSVIFLVLPVDMAAAIGAALHVFLAGMGTYWLCRQWRLTHISSLLASISFALSTTMLTRIEFYAFMASTAWCPAVLAAFTWWIGRPRMWAFQAFAVCLGLQILAGYPEAALFTLGALGIYAIFFGIAGYREHRAWRALMTPLVALAAAGLLCGLLIAVQVLPTWEAQHYSYRVTTDPELHKASLHPLMLMTLLYPLAYGTPGHLGRYWAPSCYEYWTGAFYLGVLPVVIMVTLVFTRFILGGQPKEDRPEEQAVAHDDGSSARLLLPSHDKLLAIRVPFLLTLAGFFLLYSMGKYTPVFPVLWRIIPLLHKFRWPTKSIMCFVLAMSCLSGVALDWLARNYRQALAEAMPMRRALARWLPVGLFCTVSVFTLLCLLNGGRGGTAVLKGVFGLDAVSEEHLCTVEWDVLAREGLKLALVAPAGALVLFFFLTYPARRRLLGWAMVLLLSADLAFTGSALLPTGERSILENDGVFLGRLQPKGELVRFIEHDVLAEYRLYGIRDEEIFRQARNALVRSWPLADGAFVLAQQCSFSMDDVGRVLSIYYNEGVSPAAKQRLMRMLNCSSALAFPNAWDRLLGRSLKEPEFVQFPDPLPRAYVVGGVEVLDEPENVLGFLAYADFDPLSVAAMDRRTAGGARFYDMAPGRVEHSIERIEYGPNRLDVEVQAEQPGMLVVSDAFFPGWQATLNGEQVPIYKVNGAFRGVSIPSGPSAITMVYKPITFFLGAGVSCITFVACLIALVYSIVKERVRRTGD